MKDKEHPDAGLPLLPAPLRDRLLGIEKTLPPDGDEHPVKVAAFDLDNTLLVGDVGEAVFARLKEDEKTAPLTRDGSLMPLSWSDYRTAVAGGEKTLAYRRMVTTMAGMPVRTVRRATRRVMRSRRSFLELEGEKIPIPRIHPIMSALVRILKKWGYRVTIISASNHVSVQTVAREWFSIPESQAFGIRCRTATRPHPHTGKPVEVLSADLAEPMPVAAGKADVYSQFIGDVPPRITAGDSLLDIPMLALTDPRGLIIWAGTSAGDWATLKHRLPHPEILQRLDRPSARSAGFVNGDDSSPGG